jgi:alkylation response protein AidB-like acyl-CoA dehydrogenase
VAGDAIAAVRFEGRTPYPAYAADADVLLTFGAGGTVLAHTAAEIEVTHVSSVDPLRPVFQVTTRGDGEILGTSRDVVALAWRLAVAGAACQLAGVSRRLLDMTVEYVKVREQFGRPVGSFQAVKHKLASVAVSVDMALAASSSAFETVVDDIDGVRASAAKAYAGQAGEQANVESLQLHGGIGFTWEYQLHLWMKRAMSLGTAYGTMTVHRRELARRAVEQARDRSRA